MLPYTDAEKAVIKSNLHIGNNRPMATVIFQDQPYAVRAKSISIEPVKNGAGKAQITIDNKNGIYSPDGAGEWNHIIWSNKEVSISLGYGEGIKTVFTGLIDTVQMKTFPQEIIVYARDTMKRAIDQTITYDDGTHNLDYMYWLAEDIFADLAKRAGWNEVDIHCVPTGITVSMGFVNMKYAEAMKMIAESYNYEYFAGRNGEIYFQPASDRQPEQPDEAVGLYDEDWSELEKYPVITDSIKVFSNIGKTGTEFTAGVDYIIEQGNQFLPWKIKRTADSGITNGQTVYISYVYAAWVFMEGIDILSLGYTIDDEDLYRNITVYGRTDEDTVCFGNVTYGNADYYNVLFEKTLIIEEQNAKTAEACEIIANKKAMEVASSPRIVEFFAVGNPFLWVGDCIIVVESSSKISDIYRITSLSHSYSPDSNPIFSTSITAKYFGYVPV